MRGRQRYRLVRLEQFLNFFGEIDLKNFQDNDRHLIDHDLRNPFRQVAAFENGQRVSLKKRAPRCLKPILP